MTAFSFGGVGGGFATASLSSTTPQFSNNVNTVGNASNNASEATVPVSSTTSNPTGTPIPSFSSLFPWISIYEELLSSSNVENGGGSSIGSMESTAMRVNSLEGQKLLHYLRTTQVSVVGGSITSSSNGGSNTGGRSLMEALAYPDATMSYDPPEEARLRESLRTHPFVMLHEKVTQVTPAIYQELLTLSNDLQLGLIPTIALYAHASTTDASAVTSTATVTRSVPHLARELYFQERSYMVHCLKFLLYQRLATITNIPATTTMTTTYSSNPSAIIAATDELLQKHNLISSILQLIQLWTQRLLHVTSRTATATLMTGGKEEMPFESIEEYTYRLQRLFAIQQRQALAECLYLIAYQTQWTVSEVTQILDYVHSFTDTYFDTLLDPFLNVPSIYTAATPTTNTTATNTSFITTPIITTESVTPKSKTTWDQEVITDAQNSGAIAMQSFLHTLILATLCAMDGSHTLWDRSTHAPNANNSSTHTSTRITNTLYLQQQQQSLGSIHQRLYDPSTEWKRKEIWGLFRTAYALLLLHTNTTNDSYVDGPTANPTTPNTYFQSPDLHYARGQRNTTAASKLDGIRDSAIDGVTSSAISSVTGCNTLTWIRTSLLPSFRTSTTTTTTTTASAKIISDYDDRLPVFFKSTLADFLSSYFYFAASLRELPTTRAQWTTDQESQMEYSRLQEEQRRQFSLFASSSSVAGVGQAHSLSSIYQNNPLPYPFSKQQQSQQQALSTSVDDFTVDYSTRPDCLDDLLACIVDVIFSCPACAKVFWDITDPLASQNIDNAASSVDNQMIHISSVSTKKEVQMEASTPTTKFHVTFAVEEVQRVVLLDPTITPAFLALLAALALADHAADINIGEEEQSMEGEAALAIYQFLLSGKMTTASTALSRSPSSDDGLNWDKLFYSLEAYDTLLTPKANRSPSLTLPPKNIFSTSKSHDLTTDDYYYGSSKGEAYYSYVDPEAVKAKTSSTQVPKASSGTRSISDAILSPEDEECLKAILNLMATVCSRCKLAHDHFMNLSHSSSSTHMYSNLIQHRPMIGGGKNAPAILSLLFHLLSKPLNVATKGALFNLTAILVSQTTESIGLMTWELLEACQILPTLLMSDAGTINNWNTGSNLFSPDHARYGCHVSLFLLVDAAFLLIRSLNT
jgi:hypothetical protein